MTASVIDVPTDQKSSASARAAANWEQNFAALTSSQPSIADALHKRVEAVSQWIFGRDGSLTAIIENAWMAGCSLPTRTAGQMLKDFSLAGVVGCFLDPPHAASIRVALEKLRANQAIIVIQLEMESLAIALRCEDFSADITAGRLWFVTGAGGPECLAELFLKEPGLPTPGHFIRLPISDAEKIEGLVAEAQKVFAAENTRRAGRVRALRDRWTAVQASSLNLLVLKPTQFELWNDAGSALVETLKAADSTGCKLAFFELDDPRLASPLMLAEHASAARAIVAADIARADAPGVIADGMPWITWITKGVIPPAVTAGPNDHLLVAEPSWRSLAAEAHWPADKVHIAGWPRSISRMPTVPPAERAVFVIENTVKIVAPEKLDDYSSHRLLWDAIFLQLSRDPSAAGKNAGAYLSAKMRQAGIDTRGFEPALFLDRLIYPAIQQGIVRAFVTAGVPIQLHGDGWPDIEEFAPAAAGPVKSREDLDELVTSAAVILHLGPSTDAHPLDGAEVPFIRTAGKSLSVILQETLQILKGESRPKARDFATQEALSLPKILSLTKLG